MKTYWIKWRTRCMWLTIAIVIVIVFILGRISVRKDSAGADEALASNGVSAVETQPTGSAQEYTCSMHPQIRSPNPKDKCPICGMDLIPVPADADDGDADAPVLRLSPRAAALMQVEVWPAERRDVHREVRLFGRLDYDETRLRTIAARYPGRLDRLHVNFTGTPIAKDQALADIYSPSLVTVQEELFQAIRALDRIDADNRLARETAEATVDATRERLRLLGLTPVQIDEIETRRTLAEHLTIVSPLDGVVTQRHATEGDYVETGQPIYSIADLSRLWVNMEVYESDLAWLRVGDDAIFTTQAFPGSEFTGTVAFIDPTVDPQRRTIRIRIDVPNEDLRLKPGMFVRGAVRVSIADDLAVLPLVVPSTAPLITGRRAVVYVQVPDEERRIFEGRQVTLGPRVGGADGYYVIQDGIEEGELVVVHGAFRIDSELQIRGRPSMMQPEGGRPPVTHDHGATVAAGLARPRVIEAVDASHEFVRAMTPVYEAYLELQVALSDDDLSRSRDAAKQFHSIVTAIDGSMLNGDARELWRVLSARLRANHEHVDHVDIEALRKHFHGWSNAIIEVAQRFGYAGESDVVIAHCPMAFDFAGADWLQVGRDIVNPYFGAAMYRCGEVTRAVEKRHE
ncbi:MAG TPA: efflux RND transporter periplasmic adaptor subunit [Phycisphaerales bacterium]|nr:efflux RND transporter periplasmic adaptor subunit [Phycisphaerales bacterium]HRQ76933.1 efflux RND transporter periplasmic adaptor subunit [Phycisphaerales bacterium]